jgi:hypothetical protein
MLGAGGAIVSLLDRPSSREIRSVAPDETTTTSALAETTTTNGPSPTTTSSVELPPPLAQASLGFDRLGPVAIGMTRAEAETASGTTFSEQKVHETDSCALWTPSGSSNVTIRALDGRVAAIEVSAPGSTVDGLAIGATEADVQSIYRQQAETRMNRFAIREDVVTPTQPELSDFRLVIVYETDGVTVDRFRVGHTDDVLVEDEGCA